jgi:hypothetical protein
VLHARHVDDAHGRGLYPGGQVDLLLQLRGDRGNDILGLRNPITADPAGGLRVQLGAPSLASSDDRREQVIVSANDRAKIGAQPPLPPEEQFGVAQFILSDFDATAAAWESTRRGDPRASTRVTAVGWTPYRTLWAHYFRGTTRVRSVRIGALTGPCRDLTRTVRQFPFRPVPAGTWRVYFSPSQVFDRQGVWVRSPQFVVPRSKALPAT